MRIIPNHPQGLKITRHIWNQYLYILVISFRISRMGKVIIPSRSSIQIINQPTKLFGSLWRDFSGKSNLNRDDSNKDNFSSWWFQPSWKILVKLDHLRIISPGRDENKEYLKLNHHLVLEKSSEKLSKHLQVPNVEERFNLLMDLLAVEPGHLFPSYCWWMEEIPHNHRKDV